MSYLFIANMHIFTSQDKTIIDGLRCVEYLWIIVMFLSAVWTLILTAPIHFIGAISEQVI